MKRVILLCVVIVLGITGCKSNEIANINLEDINTKIQNYFGDENKERSNLSYNYVNYEKDVVVVGLIDNSKSKQEEFLKAIFDEKEIKFIKDSSLIDFKKSDKNNIEFYISKSKQHDDIKFNDYYTNKERTIYLAGNILEFYIKTADREDTLKYYVSNAFQTLDDSIKSITSQMTIIALLKDGGTTIYKSKEKDITMIVCNTISGDKNIFIGDYSLDYKQSFCKS